MGSEKICVPKLSLSLWLPPKNKIEFTDIFNIVEETLNSYNPTKPLNIDDVIETDKIARTHALKFINKVKLNDWNKHY